MATGTQLVTQWLEASPFRRHLGMRVRTIGDGRAEIELPFAEQNCTMGDVVHGGAIAALVDTAATTAAWAGAEVPGSLRGSTVALDVIYVSGARGSDLVASARVVRRGKSICYCEVDVTDASGETVTKGLVTYKLG